MELNEIVELLKEQPEMLKELVSHEELSPSFETVANQGLLANRDKALAQSIKRKETIADLESQIAKLSEASAAPAPVAEEPPAPEASGFDPNGALARIQELEQRLADADASAMAARKREARDAALGNLKFREDSLGLAQKIIDLDSFELDTEANTFRHKETLATINDYIQHEWAEGEGKVLLDGRRNSGGGVTASPTVPPVVKRAADMTATEKAIYARENGIEALNNLK